MINIYYGRSGSGKTTKIINELQNWIKNSDNSVIFIVPEQMSFQAEYEILKDKNIDSFNNLLVYSFTRLATRIMLECGDLAKTFLDELTLGMILNYCVQKNSKKLKVFNKMLHKKSFSKELNQIFDEFSSYLLDAETLSNIETSLEIESNNQILKDKVHDFNIILKELNTYLGNTYKKKTDYFNITKEHIKKSEIIKKSHIYIDGFYNYNAQELEIIKELMIYAKEVTITFTVDNFEEDIQLTTDNLFNMPYRNLEKIKTIISENKLPYSSKKFGENLRHKNNHEFTFLETNFDKNTAYNEKPHNLEITKYTTPRDEVHFVAKQIYNIIIAEKIRYNDIAVYFANTATYSDLIKTIFPLYNIPFFIDEKKSAKSHPLIILVSTILKIVEYGCRNEYLFSLLKTTLLQKNNTDHKSKQVAYLKQVNRLENFALKYGIDTYLWHSENFEKVIMNLKTTNEKLINFKVENVDCILEVVEKIKSKQTLADKMICIYNFLVDFEIGNKLYSMSISEKDENKAQSHEQIWNSLLDLIDKTINSVGNIELSNKEFSSMILDGLNNLTFTMIPPVIDKVNIGTLKRSRFQVVGSLEQSNYLGITHAFLLGVNDQILPSVMKESALLNESERLELEHLGHSLSPSIEQNYFDDYFLAYTVISLPKKQLHISFTEKENTTGNTLYPSPIIERILKIFPQLEVNNNTENMKDFLPINVTNPKQTYYSLLKFHQNKNVLHASSILMNYFIEYFQKDNKYLFEKMLYDFDNRAYNLDESIKAKLFDKNNSISISQAELYNKCPYAHFLRYTLKINPNTEMKVESFDIGNIFHEVLNIIGSRLIEENKNFKDILIDKIEEQMLEIFEEVIENPQYSGLKLNSSFYKIKEEVIIQLQHIVKHLIKHSELSEFNLKGSEKSFGENGELIAPSFKIGDKEFTLKGVIDRYDIFEKADKAYAYVVDYKLSSKKIDYEKLLYGLSMQLPLYLYVLTFQNNTEKEVAPAGMYYLKMYSDKISKEQILNDEEIEHLSNDVVTFSGITNDDDTVLNALDKNLNEVGKAEYYNIKIKKNGELYSSAATLDEDNINSITNFTFEKIQETMTNIVEGKVEIKPANIKNGNYTKQCTYCEFSSICKFEYGIGNIDNYLEKVESIKALEKITKKIKV